MSNPNHTNYYFMLKCLAAAAALAAAIALAVFLLANPVTAGATTTLMLVAGGASASPLMGILLITGLLSLLSIMGCAMGARNNIEPIHHKVRTEVFNPVVIPPLHFPPATNPFLGATIHQGAGASNNMHSHFTGGTPTRTLQTHLDPHCFSFDHGVNGNTHIKPANQGVGAGHNMHAHFNGGSPTRTLQRPLDPPYLSLDHGVNSNTHGKR